MSNPRFFRRGRTTAFFSDVGTVDSKIDLFKMVVIVGRMLSTQNSHDFGGEAMMIFRTSESDADVNQSRGLPLNLVSAPRTSTWVFVFKTERWSLIVVILPKKKITKSVNWYN